MSRKPILCLDFDGVIHSYSSGWKGAEVIQDEPVTGAFEAIEKYLEHFSVHIYSSRSNTLKSIDAMIKWFIDNGFERIDELTFPLEKPPAFVTIDDRAITFTGIWPSVEDIKKFKPWNRK